MLCKYVQIFLIPLEIPLKLCYTPEITFDFGVLNTYLRQGHYIYK